MQLIRNHRLDEDFIDKMDAEEVVQNGSVTVNKEEFKFSYLVHYTIQKRMFEPSHEEDILYKLFVRFVTLLPLLRHVEYCGTPKVCMEDDYLGKDKFPQLGEEMRLDAQAFRVLSEDYKRSLKENDNYRGQVDLTIEIPFKPIRVPYRVYVNEINRIHGAVLYPIKHDGVGTLQIGFWDSWDQPQYIATTTPITNQLYIQSAYLLLFSSNEELPYQEFNKIVYRSQRLPIVRTLIYIEDNPDCFKGYKTEVVGFRNAPDSNFSKQFVLLRILPKSDAYCDTEHIFRVGQFIINSLKSADKYNLRRYNKKSEKSLFSVWISVPGECFDAIRTKETVRTVEINDDIEGLIVIADDNFQAAPYKAAEGLTLGKDNLGRNLESLRKQFEMIYNKEKAAETKQNQT